MDKRIDFSKDKHLRSAEGVLRGPPCQLIRVPLGQVFDAAAVIRKRFPNFGSPYDFSGKQAAVALGTQERRSSIHSTVGSNHALFQERGLLAAETCTLHQMD
jgi:hypothetical protein